MTERMNKLTAISLTPKPRGQGPRPARSGRAAAPPRPSCPLGWNHAAPEVFPAASSNHLFPESRCQQAALASHQWLLATGSSWPEREDAR